MVTHKFSVPGGEGEGPEGYRQFLYGQADTMIRHAIQHCWMVLPKEKRSVEEVERQIRRMVDRALRDWREDEQEFRGEGPGQGAP